MNNDECTTLTAHRKRKRAGVQFSSGSSSLISPTRPTLDPNGTNSSSCEANAVHDAHDTEPPTGLLLSSPSPPTVSKLPPMLPSRRRRPKDSQFTPSLNTSATRTDDKAENIEVSCKRASKDVTSSTNSSRQFNQLRLNISNRPLSQECSKCGMSYTRSRLEDEELHLQYCDRTAEGIHWNLSSGVSNHVRRLGQEQDIFAAGKPQRVSTWLVEGNVGGTNRNKLEELASLVDQSMGSSPISHETFLQCRFFLLVVTPTSVAHNSKLNRKEHVVACAILQRIERAYRVLSRSSDIPKLHSEPVTDLLRFGEDEGAIFCSPKAVHAAIGVHRVWTASSYRRVGLAQRLLDAAAAHAIYGQPVFKDLPPFRKDVFAFSQPSSSGRRLFETWTGTDEFLIFVD